MDGLRWTRSKSVEDSVSSWLLADVSVRALAELFIAGSFDRVGIFLTRRIGEAGEAIRETGNGVDMRNEDINRQGRCESERSHHEEQTQDPTGIKTTY